MKTPTSVLTETNAIWEIACQNAAYLAAICDFREGANREKLTVKKSSITRFFFFTVYVPYKP